MKDFASKSDISISVKSIQRQLSKFSTNQKCSYNKIRDLLVGFIEQEDKNNFLSIFELLKMELDIIEKFQEIELKGITYIPLFSQKIKSQKKLYEEKVPEILLSEYIQIYNNLNDINVYKDVDIVTYDDAEKVLPILVESLFNRLKKIKDDRIVREFHILSKEEIEKLFNESNKNSKITIEEMHIVKNKDSHLSKFFQHIREETSTISSSIKIALNLLEKEKNNSFAFNEETIRSVYFNEAPSDNEFKSVSKIYKEGEILLGYKNDKNCSLFHKKKAISIEIKDLGGLVNYCGSAGAGVSTSAIEMVLQLIYNEKGGIVISKMNPENLFLLHKMKLLKNDNRKIIILTLQDFLRLPKEKIKWMIKNKRIIYIHIALTNHIEDEKLKTKTNYFLDILSKNNNNQHFFVMIDYRFEPLILEEFAIYQRNFRKNNTILIITSNLYDYSNLFKLSNYTILMKQMSSLNAEFQDAINFNAGDFLLIKDGKPESMESSKHLYHCIKPIDRF